MVSSTDAAGTISQIARGFSSFVTRSWSEVLPVAFSCTNSLTALGVLLNTTHRCPALRSLRTMFAPILPSPIIPSCMDHSFSAALRSQLYDVEFHSLAFLEITCLVAAICAVCSGVIGPFQPNIPVLNEPRWSKGRKYKGLS